MSCDDVQVDNLVQQVDEIDLSQLSHQERAVQRKLKKQRAADARAQQLIAQGRRQYFENQKSAEKNRHKLYQGSSLKFQCVFCLFYFALVHFFQIDLLDLFPTANQRQGFVIIHILMFLDDNAMQGERNTTSKQMPRPAGGVNRWLPEARSEIAPLTAP